MIFQQNSRTILRAAGVCMLALAATQASAQSGNAGKGKTLMQSSGCFNCHRIGETGSRVGPNLTDIGDRREPERLQKAIVSPDDEVLPENRYVTVAMKDGSAVRGRLLNHDAMSVQLLDTKEQLRSFLNSDIKGYTILTKGLMPSFQGKLSAQDVADIVAYLGTLKGEQ